MSKSSAPKYVYRGIKAQYHLLQDLQLSGTDLVPHYEPLIDAQGRKTVSDGNEYGVYMTDSLSMAQDVYAGVALEDGTRIRKEISFGMNPQEPIRLGAVGIVYEIDTEGLDVHNPWICDALKGHYNNGFAGDEWVAERIPADHYKIIHAVIGEDTLHKEEIIDFTEPEKAEALIKSKIDLRKEHAEHFAEALSQLSSGRRYIMQKADLAVFRDLFGDNGSYYLNSEKSRDMTGHEYLSRMLRDVYRQDTSNPDFATLRYIKSVKDRINNRADISDAREVILSDLQENESSKTDFIAQKQEQDESFTTVSFDKKAAMMERIISEFPDFDQDISGPSQDNISPAEHPLLPLSRELREKLLSLESELLQLKEQGIGETDSLKFQNRINQIQSLFDRSSDLLRNLTFDPSDPQLYDLLKAKQDIDHEFGRFRRLQNAFTRISAKDDRGYEMLFTRELSDSIPEEPSISENEEREEESITEEDVFQEEAFLAQLEAEEHSSRLKAERERQARFTKEGRTQEQRAEEDFYAQQQRRQEESAWAPPSPSSLPESAPQGSLYTDQPRSPEVRYYEYPNNRYEYDSHPNTNSVPGHETRDIPPASAPHSDQPAPYIQDPTPHRIENSAGNDSIQGYDTRDIENMYHPDARHYYEALDGRNFTAADYRNEKYRAEEEYAANQQKEEARRQTYEDTATGYQDRYIQPAESPFDRQKAHFDFSVSYGENNHPYESERYFYAPGGVSAAAAGTFFQVSEPAPNHISAQPVSNPSKPSDTQNYSATQYAFTPSGVSGKTYENGNFSGSTIDIKSPAQPPPIPAVSSGEQRCSGTGSNPLPHSTKNDAVAPTPYVGSSGIS